MKSNSTLRQKLKEASGWYGWNESDPRYIDVDREATMVTFYASRCWGMYGVTKNTPSYGLMKRRLENNECPNDRTNQENRPGDGKRIRFGSEQLFEGATIVPHWATWLPKKSSYAVRRRSDADRLCWKRRDANRLDWKMRGANRPDLKRNGASNGWQGSNESAMRQNSADLTRLNISSRSTKER